MYSSPLVVDDIEYRHGYNGVRAYAANLKKMQVVLADSWGDAGWRSTDIRVESMHPGWVETPGVAEYLPRFRMITKPLLRNVVDAPTPRCGWWRPARRPNPGTSGTTAPSGRPPSAGSATRIRRRYAVSRAGQAGSAGTAEGWTGLRA
jgi:NAD(P)-dependent dehydrogenase (short-subunit alcohol dehydrogenase family)